MQNVTINILLLSYNHQRYIQQALEGIEIQKNNFITEVIVADDCSSDQTLNLIETFSTKSSHKFTFLRRQKNLGILLNYKDAFSHVAGDYIFVLEGDDYWTDPHRIEKHVEFMEAHPNCTLTMNRFTEYWEDQDRYFIPEWNFASDHEFITTSRLALGNMLGNLSACCIRTKAWKTVETNLFSIPVADWMIGMVLGEIGPVALLKEPMSVYRKQAGAQWSGLSPEKEKILLLELIDTYNHYLQFRYDKEFSNYKNQVLGKPAPAGKKSGKLFQALARLFKS